MQCQQYNVHFIFECLEWNMIDYSTLNTMVEIGPRKQVME